MINQQNFQLNRLEYLDKAMILHGMYSVDSIDDIVDATNCLHKKRIKI